MKRFKSLSLKKKRNLAIAGVSLVVLAVGGVIAYNQTATFFNNKFQLGTDNITAIDIVPIDRETAQPCSVYDKTATVTNNNTTPRYVRMKINEYWRTKDSTQTDHKTTDLPMTWDDNGTTRKYATWNADPQAEDKWSLESDGYYYYYQPLAPNATTESLIMNVSFDCHANFAGEMTYSQDGQIAEDTPSPYADSTFHVYVIFETSDEPFPPSGHIVDCDSNILYDTIACLTNGPDDGIDFSEEGTAGNGLGVNTLSAHKDDNYPVYYYRGKTVDNHVVFGGFCWRAMQTTGTGGVKLFYNGAVVNNSGVPTCLDFTNSSAPGMPPVMTGPTGSWVTSYSSGTANNIGGHYAPNVGGYMYHPLEQAPSLSSGRVVGSDAVWDGTNYTLVDPITTDSWTLTHRYYCEDQVSTVCNRVAYVLDYDIYIHRYILENGEKYDDAMHANTVASEAKTAFEEWYNRNMSTYANKIEDAVYCNDRSLAGDGFDDYDYFYNVKYNVYVRNMETYKPSVDCIDKRDAFTVSNTIGNGANNYPIGTVTADDVTLAGGGDGYMRIGANVNGTWTMSPYKVDNDEFGFYSYLYGMSLSGQNYTRGILRPVISLKEGVRYTSGDGKTNSPFVIE